ncbi:hypothetical protein EDC96DRAFT_577507 [Choanephora cucurbitarum]|nr:hypothetical protein EDC96DRAFT_577507 [Choanephora cucurbitarum]
MSKQLASLSNKSCYRLYTGNGNWINLGPKVTQDLLNIFERGEPCRYQLAPGLSIDIIPHDVDCNSKNIDLVGLMRADLVYEPQLTEHQVQQLMSHYVRNLLEEQNIVDVFPPIRSSESLPIVTSIPAHRHLSLVPMVFGSVRRGPKTQNTGPRSTRFSRNMHSSTPPSSSTASVANHEDHVTPSSASSNTSVDSPSSSVSSSPLNSINASRNKRPSATVRSRKNNTRQQSSAKRRQRQNSHVILPSVELTTQKQPPLATSNFPECPHSMNVRSFPGYAHSANSIGTTIGPYHSHQNGDHLLDNHSSHMWMQPYHQVLPPVTSSTGTSSSGHNLPTQENKSFDFEFNVDFDQPSTHRQSPTNILQEYDHHFSSRQNFNNGHSPDEFYTLQHHTLLNEQVRQPQQQMNATEASATATSESTSPLENYVPTSPIPNTWIHSTQPQSRQTWSLDFDQSSKSDKSISKAFSFDNQTANNEPAKRQSLCEVATLPMIDKVMFQQEESNNCDNILLNDSNNANNE